MSWPNHIIRLGCIVFVAMFISALTASATPSHGRQQMRVAILVVDDFNSQSESYLLDFTNELQDLAHEYLLELPEIPPEDAYNYLQDLEATGEIEPFTQRIQNTDIYAQFAESLGTDENCALDLAEQRAEARGAGSGVSSFAPHGEIVKAVLDELQATYPDPNIAASIDIIKVDTRGFSTKVIADQIEQYLVGYDFYVVNMSFAIVPCEDVADLAAYDALVLDSEISADVANLHEAIINVFVNTFERALIQSTTM